MSSTLRLFYPQTMLMAGYIRIQPRKFITYIQLRLLSQALEKQVDIIFWDFCAFCVFLELCLKGLRSCDSLFMITLTNAQVCIEI